MPTLQNRVHRLVNTLKRTGLLGIFATTAHRVIPSHGCATVQVVTLCKKCGNKFWRSYARLPNCQILFSTNNFGHMVY